MKPSFGHISSKLDEFINRFYSIVALRGTILFFSLFSFLLVSISLGVYLLDAGTNFRTSLVLLLILVGFTQFIYWVLIPLSRRFGLLKRMSYLEAAQIIDTIDHNIGEKLINGIELQELLEQENELIAAGIDQITIELKVFNPLGFVKMQRLKQAFWTTIPFVLVFVFTVGSGKFSNMMEGSERLISFRTEYLPKDFITFELLSAHQVNEGEDYLIKYKLTTALLPSQVSIWVDDVEISTKNTDPLVFEARVRNPFKDFSVQCLAGNYSSGLTDVNIVRIAKIKNYFFKVVPPAYSKLETQTINGVNVVTVPENAMVVWNGRIVNSHGIIWLQDNEQTALETGADEMMTLETRVKNNQVWEIQSSEGMALSTYELNVVKDRYPTILHRLFKDSTSANRYFISGNIQDDYGISSLKLVVEKDGEKFVERVKITSAKSQEFFVEYNANDNAKVWLEVRDNDNYNGYKMTKTAVLSIENKTEKAIADESSTRQKELQKALKEEIDEVRKSDESDNLKKNNLEDSEKSLEEMIEISNEFKKQLQRDKQSDLYNEEILAKQAEIEERMAELDEDLKKLLEDLQKLQEELAQDNDLEEQVELSQEDVMDELERMAELLERLQFEKELENLINDIDEIQQKQEELANTNEDDVEAQKELNEQFEEAKEKLEELVERSDELDVDELKSIDEENVEEISEEMKNSEENQEKGKQKKANESQKKASDKLEELKKQLSEAQSLMSSSEQSENMEDLRRLLENILVLSDNEEDLLESFRKITTNNPMYNENMNDQGQYKVDYKIIKDSLTALMHRTPAIENVVLKDMNSIDRYFEKSTNSLKNNKLNVAVGEMHYVMTSLNNLALLLNQSLDQMQSQMKGDKKGNKSCNKPGGGKPGLSELRKMQKQLGKDAEGMQKEKGGKKPGEKGEGAGGKGDQGKKMSQMMGRQEMIRMQLQKLSEEKGNGPGGYEELEELMKKNEEDLANQRLGSDFFERQREIEVKMLESEKALLEREQDEKRESESSEDEYERVKREARDAYLEKSLKGLERINWDKLLLSPFYQNKLQDGSSDRD